jgi:hypothetical protein
MGNNRSPLFVIISVIAALFGIAVSLIAIITFISGKQSLPEILNTPVMLPSSQPLSTVRVPTVIGPPTSPIVSPTSTSTIPPRAQNTLTKIPTSIPNSPQPSSGNCSWVNTIVGTWVSKNNDYATYQSNGSGTYNKNTPFHWTCLTDGQYKYLEGGSIYTLQFPDNNHYIMNGDIWTRTTENSNCSWTSLLVGTWSYLHPDRTDYLEFVNDGFGKNYSTDAKQNRFNEGQFQWTCLEDGRFKNETSGSVYSIIVDQSRFVINNDTWKRVK